MIRSNPLQPIRRPLKSPGFALLRIHDDTGGRWLQGESPRALIECFEPGEVPSALKEIERLTHRGACAVGFLSYEAGPAFDPSIESHSPLSGLPLLWFAIYDHLAESESPASFAPLPAVLWREGIERSAYLESLRRIKDYLRDGDAYQVNFTFQLASELAFDPFLLFQAANSPAALRYAAFLQTPRFAVTSLSPELFLSISGDEVISKPMKGTARRGLTYAQDVQQMRALAGSEKDRAENRMIVDMVRNDLGRVARTGTVRVDPIFEVERHPTVLQMTSTVRAETDASLERILAATFPPASVTGAPKVRATQLIRKLEGAPRGVYCGAIGCVLPGRSAQFSVAIRTALTDFDSGLTTYSVGSGIISDSDPELEFDECRMKALIAESALPPFDLFETLLWGRPPASVPDAADEQIGYWLLDAHLLRLSQSAEYWTFPFDSSAARRKLLESALGWDVSPRRVRLILDSRGGINIEAEALVPWPERPLRVALDARPIDPGQAFLYHKTTLRNEWQEALARHPDADDVLRVNVRGEVTETSRANIAYRFEGDWYTPPVECGLLEGVFRAELIRAAKLSTRILTLGDLGRVEEWAAMNSVRGWKKAVLTTE